MLPVNAKIILRLFSPTYHMQCSIKKSHYAILENSNRNDLENPIKSNNDQFHCPIPEFKSNFNSIVPSIKYFYTT